jgi:hypothetical protein
MTFSPEPESFTPGRSSASPSETQGRSRMLCTLRGSRCRRLTQHSLPSGPLQHYSDRSFTVGLRQPSWRLRAS